MPNTMKHNNAPVSRCGLLDAVRGIAVLSMILYHATWDLVNLFGNNWAWAEGNFAYVWQQATCWTFILISGFCWPLGHQPQKRGGIVFACGAVVTIVTAIVMPDSLVLFGILTFLGSAMLLMIPLHRVLYYVPDAAGAAVSFLLFCLLRNINTGTLGFEGLILAKLPDVLYRNLFTTYIGFVMPGFFSTDYFSLLPWLFLFITGYFSGRACKNQINRIPELPDTASLQLIGRNSLIIYMVHQPVVYAVFFLVYHVLH